MNDPDEKQPKLVILVTQCDQIGWGNDLRYFLDSLINNAEYTKEEFLIKFISSKSFGEIFDQQFILKQAKKYADRISFYEDSIVDKDSSWYRYADLLDSALNHAMAENCNYAISGDVRCRLLPFAVNKFIAFAGYFKKHEITGAYWRVPWFNYEEMENFDKEKTIASIRSRFYQQSTGINVYKGQIDDVSEMLPCQFVWGLDNQKTQGVKCVPASTPQKVISRTLQEILRKSNIPAKQYIIESYTEIWAVPLYLASNAPLSKRQELLKRT